MLLLELVQLAVLLPSATRRKAHASTVPLLALSMMLIVLRALSLVVSRLPHLRVPCEHLAPA